MGQTTECMLGCTTLPLPTPLGYLMFPCPAVTLNQGRS